MQCSPVERLQGIYLSQVWIRFTSLWIHFLLQSQPAEPPANKLDYLTLLTYSQVLMMKLTDFFFFCFAHKSPRHMWRWVQTLLTILELHPEHCQAKHNPELHSVLAMKAVRGARCLVRGSVGKGGQARSFTGTLQAPATLFRFLAPSSSQTERKRENNFRAPSVYSLSSDLQSRITDSGALCWTWVWIIVLFKVLTCPYAHWNILWCL